ncbi:MAG: 23S rRNA (uracil(1939)-C(5))-methyltransferase RlmD [Ignavibacteriaceae bacterium]
MKVKDIIEVEVTGYAFEGKGIAKIDLEVGGEDLKNFVVFVENGYPGDTVRVKIIKKKKNYALAKIEVLLKSSDQRVSPKCKYFGTCGGCKQQDLAYSNQVQYKQSQVKEIFERLGGLTGFDIAPIIPAENNFFYRNKMEFSFGDKRWLTVEDMNSGAEIDRSYALGLHIPNMFDKVLDIVECFLQSPESNLILNFTKKFFREKNSSVYSTKTHTGYLRNLAVRQSAHGNGIMVNLVTSESNQELVEEYTKGVCQAVPSVTTVVNNITARKSSVAVGEREEVFFGDGFIYDTIGKYKFRISANSFFQTNTLQAEKLYKLASDYAGIKNDEVVYDLYSGAGTIAIYVSGSAAEVHGFEAVGESIENAKQNVEINNVTNVFSHHVDLYKSFLPYLEQNSIPKPDVMIVDPPRNGMHENTVNDILELEPKRIVYISCNPTTQVRDIKLLCAKYRLVKINPVDMFPHTYHIENVALLEKM